MPEAAVPAPGPDLTARVGSLTFKNPVLTASGCFGYGRELVHLYPLAGLGGIVTKGLSLEPWPGNPGQRIVETPAGLLNSIGLQNPGVEHFLQTDWPWLQRQGTRVLVNVVGKTVAEYVEVARRLDAAGVDGLELNISCPNVKEGGIAFSARPEMAHQVTAAVRAVVQRPLWVKLSPNVTDITEFARAVEAAGADALSVSNTLMGMAIDVGRQKPVLGFTFGGLSGPAIKPVALRLVWQVVGAVRIPVVGLGGIAGPNDALEFLLAGAQAVQVGSALFVDPRTPAAVVSGIAAYLQQRGAGSLAEIIGAARPRA